jgi:hypothetical protein
MRTLSLSLFALLALGCHGAVEATPAAESAPPLAEGAPAEAPPALAPMTPAVTPPEVRETGAPVPADVVADVRAGGAGKLVMKLARRGYLVALRHGSARATGADAASLSLEQGDTEPVVWETTAVDTLATARGTLRIGEASTPEIRLAEAPVPAGREERRLHTCAAHEDGAGGFAVLCRMHATPTAASVTGEDEKAGVWAGAVRGTAMARLDLPASAAEEGEARMVGYAAGVDGVVIRAEASRVAGEDRAELSLASTDRPQPQIPRRIVKRYICVF